MTKARAALRCTVMSFRMDDECVDLDYLRRQALNSLTPKLIYNHMKILSKHCSFCAKPLTRLKAKYTDKLVEESRSEIGLFGHDVKERESPAKQGSNQSHVPYNAGSDRTKKLLSTLKVTKTTRCSRSPLPHRRSKKSSAASSASQNSSSYSRSRSGSRSSYSSSLSSSRSFSRGSSCSSSYCSSFSHSRTSCSGSVSRSNSSSSRSRSASPKIKKPHLLHVPNKRMRTHMTDYKQHQKRMSLDNARTLRTHPTSKDRYFDKSYRDGKFREEIHHKVDSPPLRYQASSYKNVHYQRRRSTHSHRSGNFSYKRDSNEYRGVSHLSLSDPPPPQKKRVFKHIHHRLSHTSRDLRESQRYFPVSVSTPPNTHQQRYSVSPYHKHSQRREQLRHKSIKSQQNWEKNQRKFSDRREANCLTKYPVTRNLSDGTVKSYSDSDRSKTTGREQIDPSTKLKSSESKASNDTGSSSKSQDITDCFTCKSEMETSNREERSRSNLMSSDILGDYEFDLELDYNEEMDDFEVQTAEASNKPNIKDDSEKDASDKSIGSIVHVAQDKNLILCDTPSFKQPASVSTVDEQVVANSGDEIEKEVIHSPIRVSPTHDRLSQNRVIKQTYKGQDSKLSVKERLYVDKRTIEEKRWRMVTESQELHEHPKLFSSIRPSLANRLGPSPLNNPSSPNSSNRMKRTFSHEGGMKRNRVKGNAIAIAEAYRRRKRHEATDAWRDGEFSKLKKVAELSNGQEPHLKTSSKRTENTKTHAHESALDQSNDAIKSSTKQNLSLRRNTK